MEALREKMKAVQDGPRYEHTLSVAYTAACLASVYGADSYKALKAGLLHDCAKCINPSEMLRLAEAYALPINGIERRNPHLLHAKLGAKLAEVVYGEGDEEILNAICYHTTGRPSMSLLEKIIFVADYIEPGRTKANRLGELRKLAFQDLDSCLVCILQDTMAYLQKTDGEIEPMTAKTLDYYNV